MQICAPGDSLFMLYRQKREGKKEGWIRRDDGGVLVSKVVYVDIAKKEL